MDAIYTLMVLRIGIIVFMLGFTIRYKDYLGASIVFIYLTMIITNTILHLPNVTALLGTPLVVLLSWYIINHIRGRK
jgi:hypothetical protein